MADARRRAVEALIPAAAAFPDLEPQELDIAGLDPRDAALALAIHRTVLQRWITLAYLLDRRLTQKLARLEPRLAAVLLAGAAQLLFFERLPDHAVVDESVRLAKKLVRPQAGPLVNAVLRRLAAERPKRDSAPWRPAPDLLPIDDASLRLGEPILPPPANLVHHLAVATSHPRRLVQRWLDVHGQDLAVRLCWHGALDPPTIVFDDESPQTWTAGHDALRDWLAASPARRVQDPASAAPLAATASLTVRMAVDYCAGRGTKTRQLAAMHPGSTVIATDVDPQRHADLAAAFADHPRVRVVPPPVASASIADADLLLLDVPCSNTGVLARRPGARYRFSQSSLDKLVALQRRILREACAGLRPGAHLLYSTCSLEREENQKQAAWAARSLQLTLVGEGATLPSGPGEPYHDASYHALFRA